MKAASYGVIHGLARCCDCDWFTESYKNAQALASRHAEAHGHTVEGEVAYASSKRSVKSMTARRPTANANTARPTAPSLAPPTTRRGREPMAG